jgi:predicted nucleic acid-binding protein
MSFVLDASIAAAWVIPDEYDEDVERLAGRLHQSPAVIPSLFWFETRNLFLIAERRGRLEAGTTAIAMAQLRQFPFEDVGSGSDPLVIAIASRHGISGYDASYLAVSLQHGLALATLDKRLAEAARKEKVVIEGPLGRV